MGGYNLSHIHKQCSPVFHGTFLGRGVPLEACDPWTTFSCILQPYSRVGTKKSQPTPKPGYKPKSKK